LRSGAKPELALAMSDDLDRVSRNRDELIQVSVRSVRDRLQAAKSLAYEMETDTTLEYSIHVDNKFVLELYDRLTDEIGKQAGGVMHVYTARRFEEEMKKQGAAAEAALPKFTVDPSAGKGSN